ncbi:hypothetical protein ATCCBAA256_34120 [Mycobacterium montefiorense]|nr:hypothetical protein ATCCBAA256_34120 [Mycobacterium montefiorense]
MVDDGREHLATYRAGTPRDDAQRWQIAIFRHGFLLTRTAESSYIVTHRRDKGGRVNTSDRRVRAKAKEALAS